MVPIVALFGIPALITVAILRHGLYQIDVIINRAIRYGLLSAALTAIYVLIVVGIGTTAGYAGGPLLNAAAALAIAVLFQPLRRRAQLLANRIVYGQRATPYQVLSDFARDMADQLDVDVALERMASVLAARHRRGPGGGLDPGRAAAAPADDMAARIHPIRAGPARWLGRAAGASTRRSGRSRSATGTNCSARSPCRSRGTSRCRPRRTSCWSTWRHKRAWCCATSA